MDNEMRLLESSAALQNAVDWLAVGGPVVLILLAMSVLALAIVLLKLYQFRAVRIGQRRAAGAVLDLYRRGRLREAVDLAQQSRNPAARLLAPAIRGRLRADIPETKVREEVFRIGADYLERLRAWLRPLEVIASLAPLLGLFGTVLGMIEAFQQLQAAGSRVDPSLLSGGIWEALLTTAVGLAVAIPVVVIVNALDRAIARLAHDMNDAVTQIFTEDLGRHSLEQEARHDDARVHKHALAAAR